jgi:hypothetical protein
MHAFSDEAPALPPAEDILIFLRHAFEVETDEEVFARAFKENGISDPHAEYRAFKTAGAVHLPPAVKRAFIIRVPHAQP